MYCDRYQVRYYKILVIRLLLFCLHLYIKFIFLSWQGSLTQSIRNFAKGLESWLQSAMADCPEEMTQIKVSFYLNPLYNTIRESKI